VTRVWKTGERVAITYRGTRTVGVVKLASPNGKPLMLEFSGLLGGFARMMPVSWDDECAAFRDLVVTGFVELGEVNRDEA
jgi:hypothetical protein